MSISPEGMQEPIPSPDIQKSNLLRTSLPVIVEKIGRPLQREEVYAIGFVIDAADTKAPDEVLQEFGLTQGKTPQEVKRAIRTKIGEKARNAIQTRIADATTKGDMEAVLKMQAIQQSLAIGDMLALQRDTKGEDFSLGAVPDLFMPEWIKNYR